MLWERRWVKLDETNQDEYPMSGKRDSHGHVIKETNLSHLIQQCEEFFHGKTLIQCYSEAIGSIMDWSPKCTREIAGDGIEFDWAVAKLWYRKRPWTGRRKRIRF